MKDQYTIDDGESKQDKWNRGLDIFIESVHKPDAALRQCAHNQKCYHELMDVRTEVLNHLKSLRWNESDQMIRGISHFLQKDSMTVITIKWSVKTVNLSQ